MDDTDKDRFATLITDLAHIQRINVSKATMVSYFDTLKEMPLAEFERAAAYLKKHSPWFPKPCEFFAAARKGWL